MGTVVRDEADESNNSIWLSVQTNPLLIDMVLHSLFRVVDYDTLKICRLVSTQWKSLSDSIFLQRSTFVVDGNTVAKIADREQFFESPPGIPSFFKSISQQEKEIIFSSFKFDIHLLSTSVRKVYLEPNKLSMKHFEISARCSRVPDSWTHVDDLIGPNLTKLKLGDRTPGTGTWRLSVEKLLSLRQIDLRNCELLVNTDPAQKMAPEELKLVQCDIEFQVSRELGEIVDFRYLQKLHIHNIPTDYGGASRPTLSLSDLQNVKCLTIMAMKINLNGKISPEELELKDNKYELNGAEVEIVSLNTYVNTGNIKIKKMVLGDGQLLLDFPNSTIIDELNIENLRSLGNRSIEAQVKITKFNCFLSPFGNPKIDLALLPLSLEHLELSNRYNESVICPNPVVFPNLKLLILSELGHDLAYFKNCPLLTHVIFGRSPCKKLSLEIFDVDNLPLNIKWLTLKDCYEVQPIGSQIPKTLEVLVLPFSLNYYLGKVIFSLQLLSNFIRADLVIVHGCAISDPKAAGFSQNDISQLIDVKQNMGIRNLAYGPVLWGTEECLDNFGENLAEGDSMPKPRYYLVGDDNTGKGISKSDFLNMIP